MQSRRKVIRVATILHWNRRGVLPVLGSSRWRAAMLTLIFSLAVAATLYWPTLAAMAAQWRSSTFSHGYLILPLSLFVIWKRRNRLKALTPTPDMRAIPLLVFATFGWLLGNLTSTGVVEQFCVVVFIIGLTWGVLGTAVVRPLLFPLVFLIFAVPLGESLIPGLQDFAARFAVKLLSLSQIPVLLEGRYITVPHGKWEVAKACSGVRYLISSVAVGFLFAGVMYRSWVRRIGFFLASAIIPILANGARIYGIVLVGYLASDRLALSVDHQLEGLVFFSITMLLLFLVGIRWREDRNREVPPPGAREESTPIPSGFEASNGTSYFTPRASLLLAGFLLVMVLGPLSARYLWSHQPGPEEVNLTAAAVSAPWSTSEKNDFGWEPQFVSPASELRQTYESGSQTVKLYMAYYDGGQPGGKLVSGMNQLYDRPRWLRTGEDRRFAELNGQSVQVHEVFVQSADSSLVIWHCYWVDGVFTSNDYQAKLLQAKARLLGSRQGSVAIVLATENPPPQSQGAAVLKDYLDHAAWREGPQLSLKGAR